jgi:arylsulfatase A-like enzyme
MSENRMSANLNSVHIQNEPAELAEIMNEGRSCSKIGEDLDYMPAVIKNQQFDQKTGEKNAHLENGLDFIDLEEEKVAQLNVEDSSIEEGDYIIEDIVRNDEPMVSFCQNNYNYWGIAKDMDKAIGEIIKRMKEREYYPNIFWISDHGNVYSVNYRIDEEGEKND